MPTEQQREILQDLENVKKALDSSFIVAITDPSGNIISANDKFCEISGYQLEELVGQNHRIINSGYHDSEFFKKLWKTISAGKKWEGEIRNRAKDGSFYWVHTVIVPSLNAAGKVKEYVSIRYDITAKKEQEINQTALIETAFDSLLIYNLSGKVLWCNKKAEMMFKLENISNRDVFVNEICGDKLPIFQKGSFLINHVVNDSTVSFEVLSKDYSYHGHRAYLIACRDVSERESNQSQMLQQDRLASIGLLASGLAHEIGTPLGIMRGRAELMGLRVEDHEATKSGLKIVIQQIDRISKLIHSLLGLARGSTSTTPQPTDIYQVCEDVLNLLAHEAKKNNTHIENRVHQHTYVLAVSATLFQVILNFVVNALHAIQERQKANPDHAGQLSIELSGREHEWVIKIEDNGCGISEENMKKIFNPFFTTKDVGKGTGLGLAMAYRMIESWGGQIKVHSEVNQRTQFFIHLPKATMAL